MTCNCSHCNWDGFDSLGNWPAPTRLRLADGAYVYMEFHEQLGPIFYRDRLGRREIQLPKLNDFTDLAMHAFDWWMERGKKG